MSQRSSLRQLLTYGRILLGLEAKPLKGQTSVAAVLRFRLVAFSRARRSPAAELLPDGANETELQWQTALFALELLSELSEAVRVYKNSPMPSTSSATGVPPAFGAKDHQVIRQLSALVGRWGLAINCRQDIAPDSLRVAGSNEVSADGNEERLELVVEKLLSFMSLEFGTADEMSRVTLPDLLLSLVSALLQLGEGPVSPPARPRMKEQLAVLLNSIPVTVALRTLLPFTAPECPVRTAASNALNGQLGRDGAVHTVLNQWSNPSASTPVDRFSERQLEALAKLVGASPHVIPGSPPRAKVMAQLLNIMIGASPLPTAAVGKQAVREAPTANVVRQAAYLLSRFFATHPIETTEALYPTIHYPLLPLDRPATEGEPRPVDSTGLDPQLSSSTAILTALSVVSTLLLYSPPSPEIRQFYVRPILAPMIALLDFLASGLPDKATTEMIENILVTWAKGEELAFAASSVRAAVEEIENGSEFGSKQDGRAYWARDDEGLVCIRRQASSENGARDDRVVLVGAASIVGLLKTFDRNDLAGRLFLRWLDELQALREDTGVEAAKKSVLRLQLVLKIVEDLGSGIIQDAQEVLAFVAHALEGNDASAGDEDANEVPIGKMNLEEPQVEDEDSEMGLGRDEMKLTALTLLLATLEGNPDLTQRKAPVLGLISSKLDELAATGSDTVGPLAREARLTLSARESLLASEEAPQTATSAVDPYANSRKVYQEALKLLQDPILPLRAQGLAMLRSLTVTKDAFLETDPALLPAILDIFIQALEDEDSFLYLSAIQGLSGLVDSYGARTVKKLVAIYTGAVGKVVPLNIGKRGNVELEKRLRMGEALIQCIQRAGEALAVFVDELVAPVSAVFRSSDLPVTLRASALSILSFAVESAPNAMLPYAPDLVEASLTLLSIESRPMQRRRAEQETEQPASKDGKPRKVEDLPDPLTIDPKHKVMRRAAVIIIGGFVDAATAAGEASVSAQPSPAVMSLGTSRRPTRGAKLFDARTMGNISRVLGYIRDTDEDELVRQQADQVLDRL